MAHLTDLARVYRSVGIIPFAKRVWGQVNDDDLFTWAAALAYSWLFAVFPFLIFLLTLLPYLPGRTKEKAKEEVHDMVYTVAPGEDAAKTIWDNLEGNLNNLLHQKEGKLLPRLLGLGLALWAASGGMAMTMSALDMCYEIEKGRPYYQQRPLAVGLTLVVAVLMLAVVALLPVGTLVKVWTIRRGLWMPHSAVLVLFDVARWTLSIVFMNTVVAVIYYKGPSIRHRFVWLTPGAIFSIVVWVVLALLFRLYVTRWGATYNRTYGTVGGVAVLLLFFYIDALVLLIGAEINSEVDFEVLKIRRGTRDFRYAEDLGTAPPTAI